ncbi:reprolysin-like metallopeptidase [Maribacter sp. HTCC2170]|uniref:reprolysin-like metallopeptidase n=1 Tax=Maribacter sp. (strain HTCC2170 / KCCM 42371) TaxID=313603 RepID=UPI00006BD4F9|nr:zinc-dependent metalloprotease family protein [Maribacter sp. HTCC2170]EAR02453.1 hypothetical protein FB2170_04180 [Maribacter sp. HTCC2170]
MVSKLRLVFSISILFLSFNGFAQKDYWKQKSAQRGLKKSISNRFEVEKGSIFSFEEDVFKSKLRISSFSKNKVSIVQFPDENGHLISFSVKETPVLSKKLAAKYPEIKSYSGYSLKNGKDRIRFSVSHKGIQATIIYANDKSNTYIQKTSEQRYVIYNRDDETSMNKEFICETKNSIVERRSGLTAKPVDDQQLRKYRLAVSATGEYTNFHGGTVVDAMAAINATVTRINQVFESDLGVTLEIVPDNDKIIYLDGATDPYGSNLNSEVQGIITDSIGAQNYDVGHLFHKVANSSENGGNAGFIGAVCVDNRKGSAYSSKESPIGDTFDLDYVAHEIGHQFGANHTWSFESEGTSVQAEPGSGTTIMGYAGITGVNNVAVNGDDYFHYNSILQISDYLETTNCAEVIAMTNVPPVITPSPDYIIPKSTAFALTGVASDSDIDDILTYSWEQVDNGIVTQATFGPTNPTGAMFRSQKPTIDSIRYFPKLTSVLSGNLTESNPTVNSEWETVSDVEREMNFALTVRDNAVGGGQVVADLMKVSVVNNAGPFMVTSHNTSQVHVAGDEMLISWDVANTNKSPINALNVDIFLSIDGGLTFPITLAEDIINDGSHNIIVPGNPTSQARLMIKASDNVFYAVNDTNFTIQGSEIILNFENLEYEVCQPDDVTVSFVYETYEGFNEETTFSATDVPIGMNVIFTPASATLDGTMVDAVFSNTSSVAEDIYEIGIVGASASLSKAITLDFAVYDNVFPEVTLLAPADDVADMSTGLELEWLPDESYTSYQVQIATDASFNNIIEDVTVLNNLYSPQNLLNEDAYFWKVKPINSCGEGLFSAAYSFSTIAFNCESNSAENLPLAISSIGTPTVISKIAFYEDLALADVNVNIELDHSYLSDLVVKLISPQGTTVVLLSSSCDDLQNINATFDDDAPDFTCNGDPGISGIVKPLGTLDSFKGESILGEWTLEVNDNAAADGGFLKAFSLDICIEGEFRPDEDNDGVFDDGDDLCLGTPAGAEVDLSGCPVYRFVNNNFSVLLNSEACRDSNDGSINITAQTSLDYEITITGNGVNVSDNFSDSFTLGNLMSGTYNVCIGGTDGTLVYEEHCFDVIISQPDVLGVSSKTSYDGKLTVLNLQGSDLYNIEVNGQVVQTTESEITINLKNGNNSLKVFTNLPCQGVYEEHIFLSDEPVVFPNPFVSTTNVFLGADVGQVFVEIFTADGRLVLARNFEVNGLELPLDMSIYPSGIYYIKFSGDKVKGTSKVIKK